MPYREKILPNEWRTLQFAPLWVFIIVAGADGDIKSRELGTLMKQLDGAHYVGESLVSEILGSARKEFDQLVPDFAYDNRSLQEGFADVCQVLETRVPAEEGRSFRKALLSLGHNIAEAEGKRILGSQTSPQEKQALHFIADSLGTGMGAEDALLGRQESVFARYLPVFLRLLFFMTVFSLLAISCHQAYIWASVPIGDPREERALIASALACLGVPATISLGLIFHYLTRYLRIAALIAIALLAIASLEFWVWLNIPVGDPAEDPTLLLSLATCLSVPVIILMGLVLQLISRSSRTKAELR